MEHGGWRDFHINAANLHANLLLPPHFLSLGGGAFDDAPVGEHPIAERGLLRS